MSTLRFIKKMVVLSVFIGLLVGPAWAIEETLDRAGQTVDSAVNVTTGTLDAAVTGVTDPKHGERAGQTLDSAVNATTGTFDAAVKGTSDTAGGAIDATARTGEGLVKGSGEVIDRRYQSGSERAGNAFDGLFEITDWAFESLGGAVDFIFGN